MHAAPVRGGGAGARTSVMISPGRSDVVYTPANRSWAAIVRVPCGPHAVTDPSSASSAAGSSAAGSAWAIDPPTVPRERIWGWPIRASAAASSGEAARTSSLASALPCVTMAPIRSSPSRRSIPPSTAIRRRPTRVLGAARRKFSIGTRLWPPASGRASPSEPRIDNASGRSCGSA